MMPRSVITLTFCSFLVTGGTANLMGKVDFLVTKVWPCTMNATGDLVFKSMKIYKIKQESFIDAEIISKIPFDDKIRLTVRWSQWVNGQFKPRLTMPVRAVCSGMKSTVPELFKVLGSMAHAKDCPFPPANYSVHQFSAKAEFSLPGPAGRYKATIMFVKNDVLIGCVHGEANLNPKRQ